ncbi:transmembrane and immunoglobulin domain-containing protein 2-like isoform X2 [Micropterus salmoides]|uniref:transmembrane and immunoglobulin domain-containing protein 2-like isoform X2 n=1 Tax=Micropterus salmoides TaxID=27706 RepID=UPI0018EE0655|nr:transmembrane and immunoglobulin domain-containing protein 2-like isoform X2 [Micropterus salmoides]
MKLLLSSLLLSSLCALSSWSTLVVTQSPDVSVMEGERVNITCCVTGGFERMRISWLKKQIKTETFESKNYSQGSLRKESSGCSDLIFINITREDAGRYTCRMTVEIPLLKEAEGNGTVITVTDRDRSKINPAAGSHSNLPPYPMIISLAVVGPLFIITLVYFCILRKRHGSSQAARVIYEVPHIDSEEADMDKHSTSSSRGSSQWCQVPVYESVDYFERVETKECG